MPPPRKYSLNKKYRLNMSNERYVAAVEVSSSKIVAVVGKIDDEGQFEVIASDHERGVESVRYGIVQNLEETAVRIDRILQRLERKPAIAPHTITSVFVGLSGRSLRSISTTVSLTLPNDTEITQAILDQLNTQARQTDIDSSLTVVDAIPRTYTIGKYETTSPRGMVGSDITATFDLIVCRPEIQRNLTRTLTEKVKVDVKGFLVTALSAASVTLSQEEKRQGCMLVDMGAETTTVTIYKKGSLAYFATLPMGGRNITRDITSLNVLEEKAEDIKTTSGNAIASETQSSMNIGGLKMSEVQSIIVARAEEIVANIIEQISYAGLKEADLPGGIVCIGGGSRLNGIMDLLAQKTGLNVRRGQLPAYISISDTRAQQVDTLQAISLLYIGATNSTDSCLEILPQDELPATGVANAPQPEPVKKPKARPKKRGWLSNITGRLSDMFAGDSEDDSDLIDE